MTGHAFAGDFDNSGGWSWRVAPGAEVRAVTNGTIERAKSAVGICKGQEVALDASHAVAIIVQRDSQRWAVVYGGITPAPDLVVGQTAIRGQVLGHADPLGDCAWNVTLDVFDQSAVPDLAVDPFGGRDPARIRSPRSTLAIDPSRCSTFRPRRSRA